MPRLRTAIFPTLIEFAILSNLKYTKLARHRDHQFLVNAMSCCRFGGQLRKVLFKYLMVRLMPLISFFLLRQNKFLNALSHVVFVASYACRFFSSSTMSIMVFSRARLVVALLTNTSNRLRQIKISGVKISFFATANYIVNITTEFIFQYSFQTARTLI